MDIAGHVSRQMLARYSHIRMEAKRKALEEVSQRRRKRHEAQAERPGEQTNAAAVIN